MPTKSYLINSPEERALEILYLKHEVAHNYPDAADKISLAVAPDVVACALTPDGRVAEKDMKRAQAALAALESEGMIRKELGIYSLTEFGLDAARSLFGEFETYGDLLEGARCYFDILCAERKGGGWRLL